MAMTPEEMRAWLLIQPRPAYLQITAADHSSHRLDIANGVHWIQVAQSVMALDPEVVECFAADGKTLRVIKPKEKRGADDDDDDDEVIEVSDPETQRLVVFARLIAEAYRHSTDVAFAKMVDIVEAATRRQESLERSLETAQKILTKAAAEQIADEAASGGMSKGSLLEQMIGAFVSSQQAAQKAGAVNGAKSTEHEP
jgi:hypothetical protein